MERRAIIAIILLAIVFRIYFVLKTDMAKYQFDFGIMNLGSEDDYDKLYIDYDKGNNEGRHINYIMHLYFFGEHPHIIKGQFYHPPLHHFILANWLKIMNVFSSSRIRFESMQFVAVIYSIVILIVFKKIMDELEIKKQIVPIVLFAFYPLMIFMSGSLNNDQLAMMFSIICLYYLLKWRKDPSIKNTVLGALSIGLGLMTKESVLVMLIPAVYVFFKVLYEYVENDKKISKLIVDLVILTIVVVPLGFWFHIYMNGESLGVIQPFEHLSLKEKTIFERFGLFNPFIYNGVNIWNALLFTSINYSNEINSLISIIIVAIDIVLIINWLYYFIKSKKDSLLIVTAISWWVGYFYLNITIPYISSMNARYMAIPLMIGIIDIARGFEKEKNSKIRMLTIINTATLCVCSIVYFIVL